MFPVMTAKPTLIIVFAFVCFIQSRAQQSLSIANDTYSAPYMTNMDNDLDTLGSALLLKTWVKGIILNAQDSVINDTTLLMNYDKLSGELVVTGDMKTFLHTERREIKAFVLYAPEGKYVFKKVPEITAKEFLQLLSSGPACTVYKKTITTVKGPSFRTDGIVESGTHFSKYVDVPVYYITNVTGKYKFSGRFFPTKKSIKTVFGFNEEKLNQYMAQHSNDAIDDNYITGLAAWFNKK